MSTIPTTAGESLNLHLIESVERTDTGGLRVNVDTDVPFEDVKQGRVPKPRYDGTVNWVFPESWIPEHRRSDYETIDQE